MNADAHDALSATSTRQPCDSTPHTMVDLFDASTKEKLWHRMRGDLARFFPETNRNDVLMCCTCGRFLPYDGFSIEHIIPRQALADDPPQVKSNPDATINVRSGLTLLCNRPLKTKGETVYGLGCNGWKGRFYDKAIREFLNGQVLEKHEHKKVTDRHMIALLCAAYLAMVREYGYQVALTRSGVLMREQFFRPSGFHKDLPSNSQVIVAGSATYKEGREGVWLTPFKFAVDRDSCLVVFRTFAVRLPLSRDPTIPIAIHLPIKPSKYKLRPDFRTVFGIE